MVTGFAEGFRSGYGMVENTIERRQQQKNRDEDIARSLSLREEDLAREERIRGEDRELAKTIRTQDLVRQEKIDNAKISADNARQKADEQRLAMLQAQEKKEFERNKQAAELKAAALAGHKLLNYENVARNFTQDELDTIQGDFNLIAGTALDMTDGLNLFTPELSKEIQADLQKVASGEDLSNLDSIIGGLNLVLRDNNRRLIGQTITPDAFPNAHKELQTGEYSVVETEVFDVKGRIDDQGNQFLDARVLVTVQDRDGEIREYIAPMTEGRQGSGAQYSFNISDITTAFGAKQIYNREVLQNRDKILDLIRAYKFQNESGDYDSEAYKQAFREEENTFFQNLDANRSSTIVQGGSTTYGDLATNPRLREDFIEQQVLLGTESQGKRLPETRARISAIRNTPQVQAINNQLRSDGKEVLSEREILRLTLLLSDDDGKLVMDRNSTETYKQILRDKLGTSRGFEGSVRDKRKTNKSFGLTKYLFPQG